MEVIIFFFGYLFYDYILFYGFVISGDSFGFLVFIVYEELIVEIILFVSLFLYKVLFEYCWFIG